MIYNYINKDDIIQIDDYNDEIKIFKLNNITFRTCKSDFYNFQLQLGMTDNKKIISITNRQLSYLVQKYHHNIGPKYAVDLGNHYETLKNEKENVLIMDEVFQFFDYDSVNGVAHSFDLMFYLLYHYKTNNLTSKLLVVYDDNKYYNRLLELIKQYFDVEFFFIHPNKTYMFKNFNCVRTYQNIFFNYVKKFININLIEPIIQKHDKLNTQYYDNVIKLHFNNSGNIRNGAESLNKTPKFEIFCKKNNIFDLSSIFNEELKIYLLNKSRKITIDWGSNYYININYYLLHTNDKFISLISSTYMMPDRKVTINANNMIQQYMNSCHCPENPADNIYNNFIFQGEMHDNIDNIDDYITIKY